MAKAEMKMPEDFLLKLSRLGDKTDEIIPRVLEAGGEVVYKQVKSNLQGVIGRGNKEDSRSTVSLWVRSAYRPRRLTATATGT
jgi:hypothetical protein